MKQGDSCRQDEHVAGEDSDGDRVVDVQRVHRQVDGARQQVREEEVRESVTADRLEQAELGGGGGVRLALCRQQWAATVKYWPRKVQ